MNRIVCTINSAQLAANFEYISSCAPDCRVMPIIKYDAYGLGAERIGNILRDAGAFRFGVATLEEALEVKKSGLDVQILGVLPEWETAEAVANDFICPVSDLHTAETIAAEARRRQRQVRIAVKIDTGMGRLGFSPENDRDIIARIAAMPELKTDGLFAHFSVADKPDIEYCRYQIERFKKCRSALLEKGIKFDFYHHAAGGGSVNVPEACREPFNLIRPGGMMYGHNFKDNCRQVISLTARIGALRLIRRGESAGYNRTFIADRDTPAAIITAGYADGIPLALSNRGRVLIGGRYCPFIGRVSMDYAAVDISQLPSAAVGDEVVLLGQQNGNDISIDEWANIKQTHAHDIWCAIGHRTKRVVI